MSCSPGSDAIIPESGIPKSLAETRKSQLSELRYVLSLEIPVSKSEPVMGNIQLTIQSHEGNQIILDFRADSKQIFEVSYFNLPVNYQFINDHILIPIDPSRSEHHISISFEAGDLSLNRNEDYLYTLFVPDRASTSIPIIDQPDLKGRYQVNLTIPAQWEAIANGGILSESIEGKRKHLVFAETEPIPTYLLAFAAGAFQKEVRPVGQDSFYFLYLESDQEKVKDNLDEIFELHKNSLEWLEDYTGIKYPFGKMGWATIPTFQYGGMEHPGAIFYRERSLFLDQSATPSQRLGRAGLIAHEVAHMWFGDLVTMQWFDDVWLKEVFANFMAAKMIQPDFPEIDHDVRFLLSHFPAAYSVDRTPGANSILQPLDNLKNAGSLYGDIIYHKAPIIMNMLELQMGEKAMQEGLRRYLDTFAYDNAIWDDLIYILDPTGSLDQWNQSWVKEAGMPRIQVSSHWKNKRWQIEMKAEDPALDERVWPQELKWIGNENALTFTNQWQGSFANLNEVRWTYPYVPYGVVLLDSALVDNWSTGDNDHLQPVDRAYQAMVLWENFLHARISPHAFYRWIWNRIEQETDPLLINQFLGYIRFFSAKIETDLWPEERKSLEERLFVQIQNAEPHLKKYFLDTYVSMGRTSSAQTIWHDWLQHPETAPVLLSQQDRLDILYQMNLLDPRWRSSLAEEIEQLENSQLTRRVQFTSSFLTDKGSVRDSLFQHFAAAENREQEPWVLEAVRLLNHPIRVDDAQKYIDSGLTWLEDIQATGDIFFPKRWLDALFSGHNSAEVVQKVDTFLAQRPDYPPLLKQKIQQAIHPVRLAAEINQTWQIQ